MASVPDSIGPRPFRFTVPALADVFTLLALGHLTRRMAPAPGPDSRDDQRHPVTDPPADGPTRLVGQVRPTLRSHGLHLSE